MEGDENPGAVYDSNVDRDQERARRIQALNQLARGAPAMSDDHPEPAATTATMASVGGTTPTHSRRARWLLLGGAALCVIVIGVGLARLLAPSAPTRRHQTPTSPRVIALSDYAGGASGDGGCVRDVAWSPNGASVAVLGYTQNCPQPFDLAGPTAIKYGALVSIYDARSGTLAARFKPDDTVVPAIQVPAALTAFLNNAGVNGAVAFMVNYARAIWSPDGQRLAVTFSIFLATGGYHNTANGPVWPGFTVHGVLLAAVGGAQRQVLTDQAAPAVQGDVWNVASGTPVAQTVTADGALPPALGYQWNADGMLAPQTPLNATTAPPPPALAAPGSPAGGTAFTIWQSAEIAVRTTATLPNNVVTVLPGAYTWSQSFATWSPDGRYLVASAGVALGRLAPAAIPPPTSAGLAQLGLSQAPLLPVRDAALQGALAAMPRGSLLDSASFAAQSLQLAWSPSGRVLAVRESIPVDNESSTKLQAFAVTLYDCATGKPLATLAPGTRFSALARVPTAALLRWSADGSRLLLADPQLGALYIWNAPTR